MVDVGCLLVAVRDGEVRASVSQLGSCLGLVIETAATGEGALAAAERPEIALVVLSVDLVDPCGYEVLHRMRTRHGEAFPIALLAASEHPHQRDEVASLLLGADDYFGKPLQTDLFVARARRLTSHWAMSRAASVPSSEGPRRSGLTNREREVLALLVEGYRASEISSRLCISRKTAATHIERILPKVGAHSQAQAVAFTLRDGLLDS